MNKPNWKWKSFVALIAAINIITLSSCEFSNSQATSTTASTTNSSKAEITTKNKKTTTTTIETVLDTVVPSGTPSIIGTAVYELASGSANKEDEDITAMEQNKSGIIVSLGGKLTANNLVISTSGSTSSVDESKYYGLNSAVFSNLSGNIEIKKSDISTSGTSANAVFAMGSNADITLTNTSITTEGDYSRGLNTTYNGTIYSTNCNISTKGTNSPAIGTGINGGDISVLSGKLITEGTSSPVVYSTGTVNVTNASMEAANSEAVIIDGNSSVNLTNVNASNDGANGIMIYYSNTPTTSAGTGTLNMTSGSLTSSNGAMFYVTNTNAAITLNSVLLTNSSDTLLSASADSWGVTGGNGGNASLSIDSMSVSGNILCDMFSTVNFSLINSSVYTGTINGECSGKEVNVSLDANSTWNVTGDSYIDALTSSIVLLSNIKDNGYTIYYDQANSSNNWLEGKTIKLNGGGKLTPDLSTGNAT